MSTIVDNETNYLIGNNVANYMIAVFLVSIGKVIKFLKHTSTGIQSHKFGSVRITQNIL